MDELTLQTFWQSTCSSVRSSAETAAQLSQPAFGQLILNVVDRYCSQKPPTTKEELDFRQLQRLAVTSIYGAIGSIDTQARHTPAAMNQLHKLAEEFSQQPLPTTKDECNRIAQNRLTISGRASIICNQFR